MRSNFTNNPPDAFQNWCSGCPGGQRGRRLFYCGRRASGTLDPATAPLDPTGRVFFHFTASRVWRTNDGGLNWVRLIRDRADLTGLPAARRFRSSPHNLGVSPTD